MRRFNRLRKWDGPLFRGRYLSRPVESGTYWWTLVRYIDFNPVKARIVGVPAEYPFGSAARYAHSGPRPRWLTRERIELDVMGGEDGAVYRPQRYQEVFRDPPTEQEIEIVERRMLHPCGSPDPLDDLLGAAPETVRAWQRMKCLLADGTRPGLPIVTLVRCSTSSPPMRMPVFRRNFSRRAAFRVPMRTPGEKGGPGASGWRGEASKVKKMIPSRYRYDPPSCPDSL